MPTNFPDTLGGYNLLELWRIANHFCKGKGYPVHDDDYGSAINQALLKAIKYWDPNRADAIDIKSYVCLVAVGECARCYHRRRVERRRLKNYSTSLPERLLHNERLTTQLPELDQSVDALTDAEFHLLNYVAVHGSMAAAKQLGMTNARLRHTLDTIAAKLLPTDDEDT